MVMLSPIIRPILSLKIEANNKGRVIGMAKVWMMAMGALILGGCTTGEVTTWRGVDYKKLPPGLCAPDGSPVAWVKANSGGNFTQPKNLTRENCV